MKWNEHTEKLCPIARTLGVVGESWTLLILRNCFLGVRRFDEFQQQLGMTRHVLADRLKSLVQHGVLKKVPYGENAGRYEYRLTDKGKALYPVILTLADWGNNWMFAEGEQPLIHHHQDCGHTTRPVVSCDHCHKPLTPQTVDVSASQAIHQLSHTLDAEQLVTELGYHPPILSQS